MNNPVIFWFIYLMGIPIAAGYLLKVSQEAVVLCFVWPIAWPIIILIRIGYWLAS